MRRFVFRFDAVKRQREAMLDAAKGGLAALVARQARAAEDLADRRAALAATAADGPRAGAVFDPRRERIRQLHLQALRDAVTAAVETLARVDAELAAAREQVAEAHRRLRAIEVLEERDREVWRAEAAREEQKAADERSAQRFGRD